MGGEGPGGYGGFNVLLVEEHHVARVGLLEMLRGVDSAEVASIRSASSADAAYAAVLEYKPNLLMLSSDLDVAYEPLFAEDGARSVLVLVRSAEPGHLTAASRRRANGFIMEQDLTVDVLTHTLAQLRRGEMPIPAVLARQMLHDASRRTAQARDLPFLTPRESQVLALLSEGMSNKQIARRLEISPHGAKRHVANVLMKLHCPNRTMAVARALSEGLLDTPHRGAAAVF